MTSRKKPIDKEIARQLRAELYVSIDRGELSLQEAVKRMRKISRLTQAEFATHLGVSAKVIKEVERGIGNPTAGTLNRIGQFFGLEVAFVRSEKLRGNHDQSAVTVVNPVIMNSKTEPPRSGIEDMRRLVDELESIKKKVVPTKQLKEMLKGMEKDFLSIHAAQSNAEAVERMSRQGGALTDLERIAREINPELQAVKDAQAIIDSAEKIQRQIQPPQAVKQWLADIEAAKKLMNPFENSSQLVLREVKKN